MQARLDLTMDLARPAGPARQDPLDALRLARSRNVGPATWSRLVRRFGSPGRALEALPDLAQRGGAKLEPCSVAQAERELAAGDAAGARLLVLGEPDYPKALAEILDPPPILWMRGDADVLSRPAAALVGARNASAVGLRMARLLAAELGEAGLVVASGLARGVDGAAHEAALATGTVAALAGCVKAVYPAEHADLADRIAAEGGALLSEAPVGLEPQARHFPRRNRVIAGLARGVVLIEAAERSGSLITAEFALEQGREVMAVPGSPLDPRSAGGNGLIRQGAVLVRSAADVIEALEAAASGARAGRAEGFAEPVEAFARPLRDLSRLRADVVSLLGPDPVEEDELARLTGAGGSALAEVLLELELAGRLDRRPGGMVALLPE